MEIFNIITLAISGLLLFSVGTMRLTNPIKAYAKNSGITLEKNADLLNEMRGVSALMMLAGLSIGLGAILPKFQMISFTIAVLLFIGFAIGRSISIGVDGKPNKQIIQGLASEVVLGGLNIFGLLTIAM